MRPAPSPATPPPPLWFDVDVFVQMRLDVPAIEPTNFVKGGPELRRLVDINLARLLRICLSKLLANPCPSNLLDENPPL